VQATRQLVAPQAYGEHVALVGVEQLPLPSQNAAGVSAPEVQEDAAHCTELPLAKPLQVVREVPSHAFAAQIELPASHAVRLPCGAPVIALHVPVASQASHCPVHATLQQTPSAQNPLLQSVFAAQLPPRSFSSAKSSEVAPELEPKTSVCPLESTNAAAES
jgi:hypothetical protein